MRTIKLTGHVDEQHRLNVEVPADVPPGPVAITLELEPTEEGESSQFWAQAVSAAWATEWSDPREDIYTLEDGKPVQ